jgi:class 3 adenylate cyclase/tetratricopeptide (TPR) repeat protein
MRATSSQIEGERKPVSIFFADIVGSTAMAEKLDPEEWREIINEVHRRVSDAIYRYEGTIAQLLGDGVLAFFGAPITHEDDPIRAARAALDLQKSIEEYGRSLTGYLDNFQMRVGINTGEVVIGHIGTDMHAEYLAIGDAVNLAARLESAARPGRILVSENCARLIQATFELEPQAKITVKGISKPQAVFELVKAKAKPERGRGIKGLSSPLVGREGELRKLRSSLSSLKQGRGQIGVITGEAGIGKTRLVEEARALSAGHSSDMGNKEADPEVLIAPGLHWLEGRSPSYGSDLSYWAITQLLLADLGLSDGDPEAKISATLRRRVSELFDQPDDEVLPFLFYLLGLKQDAEAQVWFQALKGEMLKQRLLLSLKKYFTRVAELRPTILVFEDVHWADPSSLEVIKQLFSLTDRVPLMVLMLLRIERDHGSWIAKIEAETNFPHRYTEIHLKRLSSNSSTLLINHLLDIAELPDSTRQLILARSEGNPFYLEEIIRHLIDREVIIHEEHVWRATKEITEIHIPDTLHGVLLARIDRLEEDVRTTLQIASVIGKSFLFRILDSISEAEHHLETHLSQLQRVDLVREKTRWPELEYIFKHSLSQEAAYNSLLVERRRLFHFKVAEALETLFHDRKEEFLGLLAHHYYLAESHKKAASYMFMAGEKAFRDGAMQTALKFVQQASDLYEMLNDAINFGDSQGFLGIIHWGMGDREASLEHLYRALSILENEPESPELAWVVTELSRMHMVASEYDEALRWGERGLALAEKAQLVEVRLHALISIGSTRIGLGDFEQGINDLRESLRLSIESDFENPAGRAYFNLIEHYAYQGQYAEARTLAEEYREYSREVELRTMEPNSLVKLTEVEWICGLWDQAIKNFSLLTSSQTIWGLWSKMIRASIQNDLGQPEETRNELEADLDLALSTNEIQTIVPYLGQLARSYAALGFEHKVDEVLHQILEWVDSIRFFEMGSTMPLLFAIEWFASRRASKSLEDSRACVARLERAYDRLKAPPMEAALAEGKGIHALAEGHVREAIEHLNQATSVWERLGRPYDQARALRGLGRALAAAKDVEAAKACYARAAELIDTLAALLTVDEMRKSFLASELVTNLRQEQAALEAAGE